MVKHIFYHFLETKEKEEENRRCDLQLGRALWELVERNNHYPQLLYLFPWEIKKVITAHDLECQIGLELNPNQVKEFLLVHWDSETKNLMINGEKSLFKCLIWAVKLSTKCSLQKWPNRDMYLILGNWFMEFVANKNLTSGMTIRLYWDKKSRTLRVSVLGKFI